MTYEKYIDKLVNKTSDPEFVKFCSEVVQEIGITAKEWNENKAAILVYMANLDNEVEQAYLTWRA